VQDEVRYFGIETGVNSHQPRTPGEVLSNRFGDCKDKVALFCSLARAAGIDAWPVLVHTWRHGLVAADLPSPLAFNHVIAALSWRGGILFLDPTRVLQGGSLEESCLGDLGWGLLLRPGSDSLQALPAPRASTISRTDLLRTADASGPADLDVRYQYTGEGADRARAWLAERGPDALRSSYTEEFRDQYGEVTMTADPAVQDDRAANRLELTVGFRVERFLTTEEKRVQFAIYPSEINQRLRDPETVSRRTQPMYFEHPITVTQDQVVELPAAVDFAPSEDRVDDPSFVVTSSLAAAGKRVSIHSEFRSLKDRVEPADWARFVADLEKSRQAIGWTVSTEAALLAASAAPLPAPGTDALPGWPEGLDAVLGSLVLFLVAALSMGADF
jgi:hypothetical protein